MKLKKVSITYQLLHPHVKASEWGHSAPLDLDWPNELLKWPGVMFEAEAAFGTQRSAPQRGQRAWGGGNLCSGVLCSSIWTQNMSVPTNAVIRRVAGFSVSIWVDQVTLVHILKYCVCKQDRTKFTTGKENKKQPKLFSWKMIQVGDHLQSSCPVRHGKTDNWIERWKETASFISVAMEIPSLASLWNIKSILYISSLSLCLPAYTS